jgi:hypothetical protein
VLPAEVEGERVGGADVGGSDFEGAGGMADAGEAGEAPAFRLVGVDG